jgi:hypothetical protein
LLFWKEAWVNRVHGPEASESLAHTRPETLESVKIPGTRCSLEALTRATQASTADGEERYYCQATDMFKATAPIRWCDLRHYAKDIASRNVSLRDFIRYVPARSLIDAFRFIIRLNWRGRSYPQYPLIRGLARGKTPTEMLDLKPGELVRVRSKNEIMRTINAGQKNRGLWYDEEMLPYCNKVHKVFAKVERIIDEKTGKMINIPGNCIILEGVFCSGTHSSNRLFCPRSIYPYWREIWLKRVTREESELNRN